MYKSDSSMLWYSFEDAIKMCGKRAVIVYGAGNYGKKLVQYMKDHEINHIVAICDRDSEKWGNEINSIPIYSFEQINEQYTDAVYFLLGIGPDCPGNAASIFDDLIKHIPAERIFVIIHDSILAPCELRINNSKQYVEMLYQKAQRKSLQRVTHIKSLTYRAESRSYSGGGAGKVLKIQEMVLGSEWHDIFCSYHYKTENFLSSNYRYLCNELLAAVEFAKTLSEKDENVVYIVHDIFSASGLAANGKRYALIYHSQGETVYEMEQAGRHFTDEERALISELEVFSIRNAYCFLFPSKGAEQFFCSTWRYGVFPDYKSGPPMYNTIIPDDLKTLEPIPEIEVDKSYYTFLSIGQMTASKGMDQIPGFLKCISKYLNKKIRWIVVAKGPLKNNVISDMSRLCERNTDFKFYQFDYLPHDKINYLFSVADAYIMLHRISIFDLATLEAMYNNLHIILSDIQGNVEFNKDNNINLVSDKKANYGKIANILMNDIPHNKLVYEKYFSMNVFRRRYEKLMELLTMT